MGMTRRERVIRLESADDIRANLLLGGAGLAAKLGGELERGATVDIAMVMVGKIRSAWRNVSPGDLVGNCKGASHIVSGATVGAFAVDKGDRTKTRAVAEVFGFGAGGGHSSASSLHVVDGELQSCMGATPDSPRAPAQCGAMMRVELLAITTDGVVARDHEMRDTCTPPLVRVDGICKRGGSSVRLAECAYGNAVQCRDSCEAGVAKSCSKLAHMVMYGAGGLQLDPSNAARISIQACNTGDPAGCTLNGEILGGTFKIMTGVTKDLGQAARLFAKACDAGDAKGCWRLGEAAMFGYGLQKEANLATSAYLRACEGGFHSGCADLSVVALGGTGGGADYGLAATLSRRACEGNDNGGCSVEGITHEFGLGTPRNVSRAVAAYTKACSLDSSACRNLGMLNLLGKGMPRDEAKGLALIKRACVSRDPSSCAYMKAFLDGSQPLETEAANEMVPIWGNICAAGVVRHCSSLGLNLLARGNASEGRKLLARACTLGDEWGCLLGRQPVR